MIRGRWKAAAVGAALLAAAGCVGNGGPGIAGTSSAAPSAGSSNGSAVAASADPVTVMAVGDIAAESNLDARVAELVASQNPASLLLVGDVVYQEGTAQEFARYFEPDWGRFAGIWMPVPGNHEYKTPGVAGYRAYFGVPDGPLYSSRRVGAWQVIGLDSETPRSSAQLAWLRAQLAANDGVPTLVMWHRPRYSSGEHGDQADTDALWDVVKVDPDVRLILWGHDHNYERMAIPVAGREPVTAMVVGTGGGELRPTPRMIPRPWRQFYVDQVIGAVSLRLAGDSFSWAFLDADGRTLDTGSQVLRPAPAMTVGLRTVRGGSRIRVDVDPNLGRGYWTFRVQRMRSDGTWSTLRRSFRTKGSAETRTVNLRKGTYRVVVAGKHGYAPATSQAVSLVR